MIALDVNVLVNAWQPSAPQHAEYRHWLERLVNEPMPVALAPMVLSGAVRVLTHPRIFERPNSSAEVLERIDALRQRRNVVELSPGKRHWALFGALCRETHAQGNDVPDAFLAALAIESGSTWITADRGFCRFPGLDWRHPFDGRG